MPASIVILSDGTGNSQASPFKTNVWRLYSYLDLKDDTQISKYDDGVGSASNVVSKYLGGMFGFGLKRNVIDLYIFLSKYYIPETKLYFFGFSRGAFTIRILIDFIGQCGLLSKAHSSDDVVLRQRAEALYRQYRRATITERVPAPLWVSNKLREALGRIRRATPPADAMAADTAPGTKNAIPIEFVGLWDTVDAYVIPIEEIRNAVDRWLFPVSFRNHKLSGNVKRACHALALDDARSTFHPVLWEEDEISTEEGEVKDSPGDSLKTADARDRILQLWFAGAHTDVGGGYPDDRLAYVPLLWIMQEAAGQGLKFKPGALQEVEDFAWPDAPVHDSREGFGAFYRYKPRLAVRSHGASASALVRVHRSVHDRMYRRVLSSYAPLSLPTRRTEEWAVKPGALVATARGSLFFRTNREMEEHVLDLIWWRRVGYFAFVFASMTLLALPFLPLNDTAWLSWVPAFSSLERMLTKFLATVGSVASFAFPAFARPWVQQFENSPVTSFALAALLMGIWNRNAALDARIAFQALNARTSSSSPEIGRLLAIARYFRTNTVSRRLYRIAIEDVVPGLLALLVLAGIGVFFYSAFIVSG